MRKERSFGRLPPQHVPLGSFCLVMARLFGLTVVAAIIFFVKTSSLLKDGLVIVVIHTERQGCIEGEFAAVARVLGQQILVQVLKDSRDRLVGLVNGIERV